jgi:hypothetical protein
VPEAIVAREAYFAYLRKFAEKYGFAIRVDPKGEYFAVMLSREDLRVESTNALRRDRFWLGFYTSDDKEADEHTRQKVAAMKADLKATLPGTHVLAVDESK